MATPAVPDFGSVLSDVRKRITTPIPVQAGSQAWAPDAAYDAATRHVQTGLAQLGSNLDLTEQRARQDWEKGSANLADIRDKTLRSFANKMGSQGIGYSSINVEGQGDIGSAYLKDVENLGTSTTRGLEDAARNTLGQVNALNTYLSEQQAARGERETARQEEAAMRQSIQEQAAKDAESLRTTLTELKDSLLKQLTPQPTPTGQLKLPPPPPPPKPPAMPRISLPPAIAPQYNNKDSIMEMQHYLNQVYGYNLTEDGMYGPKTKQALIDFQSKHGMEPTGRLDEATATVLQRMYFDRNTTPGLYGRRGGQQEF